MFLLVLGVYALLVFGIVALVYVVGIGTDIASALRALYRLKEQDRVLNTATEIQRIKAELDEFLRSSTQPSQSQDSELYTKPQDEKSDSAKEPDPARHSAYCGVCGTGISGEPSSLYAPSPDKSFFVFTCPSCRAETFSTDRPPH